MPEDKNEFPAFSHSDYQKLMENLNWPSFDMSAFLDMGRKNAQTLANIQQLGLEAWQDIITTSQQIMQELASEQAQMMTSVMNEGSPEEKVARATTRVHDTYDRTHSRYRALAEIQHQLSQDMSELIARRIKANLNDLKDVVEK